MKKIASIFFFLFIGLIIYAQDVNFAWVKQISIRRDSVYNPPRNLAIAVDPSGNVYTTGTFAGIVDFDPGPGIFNLTSGGSQDIFISKLSADGNFMWVKQMVGGCFYCSGSGNSIIIDVMGNIHFSGTFYGVVDFDPGSGVFNLSGLGNGSAFVSTLDAAGNLVWAKQMEGRSNTAGKSMKLDGLGNVYTTGVFDGTVDFDPGPGTFNLSAYGTNIFISKLNSSGDFIWAKATEGTGNGNVVPWENVSLSFDNSENVYIAGNFWGLFDFDPGPGVFYLTSDNNSGSVFVLKLDTAGKFVWAKQMGGYSGHGNSMSSDVAGNIYVTGSFSGAADFDPGPGLFELTASSTENVFVSKLDAAGNLVWAKQTGGNGSAHGNSISLDIAGNIYITGSFSCTVDFDLGPSVYNLGTIDINAGMFVSKLDMNGNFIWAKQIGGGDLSYAEGHSITLDVSGNIYTAGEFNSLVDFDPGPGIYNLASTGGHDIFVHKMSDTTFINTYINTYTSVLAFEPCTNKVSVEDASTFNTDDTVLLIQMKGAVIDSTNKTEFGAIADYKNAGNYEFNYIKNKGGNIIELKNQLTWQYDIPNGKVQLVRVPYYQSLNITSTLTCLPWDGRKGGILVLNVQDTLELNADIDVSGKGFKGGSAYQGQYECGIDSLYIISANGTYGSAKGEGIFFNTRLLHGRGKVANGGGGGNSTNSGGAGGGNGGNGGEGGKEWVGCNNNFINGGIGGSPLTYNNTINKIFLGGGGGAGQMNDFQLSGGGNGGGIVIINTNCLKSNSRNVKSEGETPVHIIGSADDGRSGGGAGGTILINYGSLIDSVAVSVKGGNGDYCIAEPDWYHGPGGGGGGGIIWTNKPGNDPLLTTNLSGGVPGTNVNIGNNAWGATSGQNGNTLYDLAMPVDIIPFVPGTNFSLLTITICEGQNYEGYTTNGTYIDTLTLASGCESIRTLILTVKPRLYSAIVQTICSGQTYSGYSVSGTYIDTLVATNGCDSVRTIDLTVKSRSFSAITQSICQGQNFAGYTASGIYSDTLVAVNGCDSIRTIHLNVQPARQPYLGEDTVLCSGDALKLYPGPFNTYRWQDGSAQSHFTAKQPGLYSVVVTDNCISSRDEIFIKETDCTIYFPSAFTPNNDGKNDWFKILNAYNVSNYHLSIYNRWGKKVFETFDPAKGWNGLFNGLAQSSTTFVWYCEFNKPGNAGKTKMKGTVTLIK